MARKQGTSDMQLRGGAKEIDSSWSFEDRFSLGRRIGGGAFGEVWECVDRESRESAACKVVQKAGLGTRERSALEREVGIMRRVGAGHPGVVSLLGATSSPGAVQVVMELCRGGDLFDLVRTHGALPEPAARLVFCQLASALEACHTQGVIHRDIKPENILLDRPAQALYRAWGTDSPAPVQAKLADFGLAAVVRPGETTTGMVGSPYYMAPEILKGHQYGRRVDVWSLGVVLCVMLTRRVPFHGRSSADTAGIRCAILRGHVDFSLPCWRNVSAKARDLISKMLQLDPQNRLRAQDLRAHPWCTAHVAECMQNVASARTSHSFGDLRRAVQDPSLQERNCTSAKAACLTGPCSPSEEVGTKPHESCAPTPERTTLSGQRLEAPESPLPKDRKLWTFLRLDKKRLPLISAVS